MNRPPTIKNLPLNAMRAFEAAARKGSFKEAAHELSVTPAAISHHVSALENYMGTELFIRSNRQLKLTVIGKDLAQNITHFLDQLLVSVSELKLQNYDTAKLIVSCPPSLASKWLVPRIHIFRSMYPEINLYVQSENQSNSPFKDLNVDIALRYSKNASFEHLGIHSEKLWKSAMWIPVCSPLLIDDPKSHEENLLSLLKFPLLRRPLPPYEEGMPSKEVWSEWIKLFLDVISKSANEQLPDDFEIEKFRRHLKKSPFYSHDHLTIDAAIAGRGISLALEPLVIDEIEKGKLVRLFKTKIKDPFSYFILCRKSDLASSNIQAFINWLHAEASGVEHQPIEKN